MTDDTKDSLEMLENPNEKFSPVEYGKAKHREDMDVTGNESLRELVGEFMYLYGHADASLEARKAFRECAQKLEETIEEN